MSIMQKTGIVTILCVLLFSIHGIGAENLSGTWEYIFTRTETDVPPDGTWREIDFPADLTRQTRAPEGFFWVRRRIELPQSESALILGKSRLSERVYIGTTLIGGSGTTGEKPRAAPLRYRGYGLPRGPGEVDLYIRLHHQSRSAVYGKILIVDLKNLQSSLFRLNFFGLALTCRHYLGASNRKKDG